MNYYYDGPDDAMVDAANIGQSLMTWIAANAPDAVWDTSPVDVVNDLAARLYDAEQRAAAAAADARAWQSAATLLDARVTTLTAMLVERGMAEVDVALSASAREGRGRA